MNPSSLLRPFVFITACLSVAGSALAETFGSFTYTSDGTSVTITGHDNVVTPSLVIPAEINGLPVRTITRLTGFPGPGELRSSVTSITIPQGVTTIGGTVFRSFTALQAITLPESVTSVGARAFEGCTALTTASFGNGVTSLDTTFWGCVNLTTVDLPDQLTSLYYTFSGCTNLTAIQIPASVTALEGAFRSCPKLASVALPASLTALGDEAFNGCTSLTSLNLPSGLTTIGDNAFRNCPGLTTLVFPPALTTIGTGAFEACTGLTSLIVPSSVTTIGDDAFWGCTGLSEASLPPRFLASIANIGLDHEPQLASDLLVEGIADRLANSPSFISDLADAIIAKSGHYGLSTQADITNVVNQTPQTVRDIIAEVGGETPAVHGITSDLGTLTVKKGKPVAYTVTTTFGATAFAAIGLPDGVVIHPTTGAISGKAKKVGTYNVFLHAGVPGGGAVSAVKVITVTL